MFKNGTLDYSFPIEKDGQKIALQKNKHRKKLNTTNLKLMECFQKFDIPWCFGQCTVKR